MTVNPERKRKIFISYAREDKAHVRSLVTFLEASGHKVWWDHLIHAGSDYREEIQQQIQAADKVVVIWSSHSVKSPFVIDEAQRANEAEKLVPIVMDVSRPPMGFGHLHAVSATDIESEFPAILAAIEDRLPPSPREANQVIRMQRRIIVATVALLAVVLIAAGGYWFWRQWSVRDPTAGLNPSLNYQLYRSEKLKLQFVYPREALMVDTTHESDDRIPLLTLGHEQEVLILRTPLPDHNNIRIGQRQERQALEARGYSMNYVGPSDETNWSNWYILSGAKPDGSQFYYRRWYTSKDVVSIEFDYPKSMDGLYADAIGAMTLNGHFVFE